MQSVILMPVVFLFFASLLIWIIIGSRGFWWLKLFLMILALVISVEMYVSLDSYRGHPLEKSYEEMPDRAWLLWSYVEEPDKSTNNPGGVYMLLRPRDVDPVKGWLGYFVPSEAIRLYKLPYSRENHKEAQDLQLKIDSRLAQHDDAPLEIAFKHKLKRVTGGSDTKGVGEFYELPEEKRIPKPDTI
jgi:hypothetical protein